MTRKEIYESHGISMLWKPGFHDVELSEEEIQETHKFAQLVKESFENWAELGGKA